MRKIVRVAALGVITAACSKQPAHQPQGRVATGQANAVQNQTRNPSSGPEARAQLAQPTAKAPTTDPKSTEAAEELVRHLAALLNGGKFDEAYMLLGPGASPRAQFDRDFSRYSDLKVTLGAPGDQEGAAGSIYLSIPLSVSGTAKGKHLSRSASAILRRVNDVPGSTEAQRHWHIERIDWGDAA